MKFLLLWLLSYFPAAGPPAPVRVTFSPITKAAYLAALKAAIATKPAMTFPLKKVRGRIVIPTTKGRVVFKDNNVSEESPDWEKYTYLGYSPQLKSHLIEHSHYEWISDILLEGNGRQMEVFDRPAYSPDFKIFVTISAGIEYSLFSNSIRLYRFENHHWRQVWELEPSVEPATWEPDEIHWLSNSTLLLKKKMWTGLNPGSTFTYDKLMIQP